MRRTISVTLFVIFLAALTEGAERNLRFAKKFQIPGMPEMMVVAEGDYEPRSAGSYALKVYGGTSKKFPTDDFVVGIIRPRNGTVEAVRFADIDGDDGPEIIVVVRSVGSGGYVSGDAFRYRKGTLEVIASVSGLDNRADPIRALPNQFGNSTGN